MVRGIKYALNFPNTENQCNTHNDYQCIRNQCPRDIEGLFRDITQRVTVCEGRRERVGILSAGEREAGIETEKEAREGAGTLGASGREQEPMTRKKQQINEREAGIETEKEARKGLGRGGVIRCQWAGARTNDEKEAADRSNIPNAAGMDNICIRHRKYQT
jgi:hypothetical protein